MLRLLDHDDRRYLLAIEYKGKEYNYIAKIIQSHAGEQEWWIWAKKEGRKVILQFTYNTALKKLQEKKLFGQPPLPEDFLQVLEQSFNNKS